MKKPKSRAKAKRRKGRENKTLSDREFEVLKRCFRAIALMRHDGLSLEVASREEGTTGATVRKHLPRALRKEKGGRWVATKADTYTRLLSLPGLHGPVSVRARGSKAAKLASDYLASLARWAKREKSYELAPFRGKKVGGHEFITAPRALRALRDAGLLQLDSLYAALKEAA